MMPKDIDRVTRRYEREKRARQQAESLLEEKSRELYEKNQNILQLNRSLESLVQELVVAKDEAEARADANKEFLANMSHEIRTPLNGVLGSINMLQKTPLNDRQSHLLNVSLASGQHLLSVIDDILEFSRLSTVKIELETITFNPILLLEQCLQNAAMAAQEKKIELIANLSLQLPNELKGDPTRLKQVVTNLLGNAIKFTDRGYVQLDAKWQDNSLFVKVIDTGIGIKKENLDMIFESFGQADSSTVRKYGGTGLGLSICGRIVKAMGGSIQVESQLGKGSQFSFNYPITTDLTNNLNTICDALNDIDVLVYCETPLLEEALIATIRLLGVRSVVGLASLSAPPEPSYESSLIIIDGTPKPPEWVKNVIDRFQQLGSKTIQLRQYDPLITCNIGVSSDVELTKPIVTHTLYSALSDLVNGQKKVPVRNEQLSIAPLTEEKQEPENVFAGRRLLVVDDNAVNLEVASYVFAYEGFEVLTASNGHQAIQVATQEAIDVIFMDIQMPEMDGLTATRNIRCVNEHLAQIPIYALTAHAMQEDIDECLASGMNGHFNKPIEPEKILPVLEKLFDKLDSMNISNSNNHPIQRLSSG